MFIKKKRWKKEKKNIKLISLDDRRVKEEEKNTRA